MPNRRVVALAILFALLILLVGFSGAVLLFSPSPNPENGAKAVLRMPPSPTPEPPRSSDGAIGSDGLPTRAGVETTPGESPEAATVEVMPTGTPVDSAPGTPTASEAPRVRPTDMPYPTPVPEPYGGPVLVPNHHSGPRWVTLQAGHWNNGALPEELQHLTTHTGAFAAGVSEVDVTVAVARLTAQMLFERGYSIEILDATVPPNYTSDLFLALHADGNSVTSLRGFKAVAPWNFVPASDTFVGILYEEFGKATGLPTDARTSVSMANYYAFNPLKYRHAASQHLPSALLEMGYITNQLDREVLTNEQGRVAWGIANAVDRFFRSGAAGNTPTPYPTFTPSKTPTRTQTPSPTRTVTQTETATPLPPDVSLKLTATVQIETPGKPTNIMPTIPTATRTPLPTSTPLTGTITTDGRWLPPLALNGRQLPPPGSEAAPVLLGWSDDDPGDGNVDLRVDWQPHIWRQYYVPRLGRSIWVKGPAITGRE